LYEPLHHKYRPQTFAQLVGQGAIAATLTNALQQNRIAPAYLFCGPRGTGKTSSARILAKSLNCLTVDAPTEKPCGKCDVCQSVNKGSSLDIVEIDAASNTGVDNIRELIERSQFAPVQCRYKVYVIDECHMLSTAAFNALLKTLEEPPDRVVFVLATTDPQRVLPTIISRCQRFDFRRIPLPSMIKHLQYISVEESIAIAPSATQLVAQISQGGLRDAESLLDQLSLQADEISVESVWDLVGAVPERDLLNLVRAIAADDGTALLERVRHLMDKGREPLIVLQSLVGFYRDLLIAKRAPTREDLVAITPPTWAEMTDFAQNLSASQLLASQQKLQTSEVQVKNTTQPRLWLEITLTGLLPSALGAAADLASSAPQSRTAPRTASSANTARPKVASPPPIAPPVVPSPVAPLPALSASPATAATPAAPADTTSSPPPESPIPSTPLTQPTQPSAPSASPAIRPTEDGSRTTVSPEPAAADEPTDTPPPAVAFGSMADLWNKILAVLLPRGTQILMAQQGVLLGFDGVGAKVGFRSASLQKLAQSRVPNLEAAFESIFQRKIKVSLEVVTPEESPVVEVEEPPPAPPARPVQRGQQSPPSPSSSNNPAKSHPPSSNSSGKGSGPAAKPTNEVGENSQNNSLDNNSGNNLNSKKSDNSRSDNNSNRSLLNHPGANGNSSSAGRSHSNAPLANEPSTSLNSLPLGPPSQNRLPSDNTGSSRLDPPSNAMGFDQDQEKVKRFANFFNGEIVNLDEGESPDKSPNASGDASKKSSDPGPDVPF